MSATHVFSPTISTTIPKIASLDLRGGGVGSCHQQVERKDAVDLNYTREYEGSSSHQTQSVWSSKNVLGFF